MSKTPAKKKDTQTQSKEDIKEKIKNSFLIPELQECSNQINSLKKEKIELGSKKEDKKRKVDIDEELETLKLKYNGLIPKENAKRKEIQKHTEAKEKEENSNKEKKEEKTQREFNNEEKKAITELFEGNYRYKKFINTDEIRIPIYYNNNVSIEFDKSSNCFDLSFEYETKDSVKTTYFGVFNTAKRIKRNQYVISEIIENKDLDLIQVFSNPEKEEGEDRLKEYNVDENPFAKLGNDIKVGNPNGEYVYLPRKTIWNFLKSTKLIPKKEERVTNVYGIFDKDKALLPPKINLDKNIVKTNDIKSFERLMEGDLLSEDKLKEIAREFKRYLEMSRATQLAFFHSLFSVYRYSIMNNGFKEGSFFGLKTRSTRTGKSTRVKIVNNLFLYGFNSDGLNQNDLGGSGIRLNSYQSICGNVVIDDSRSLNNPTFKGVAINFATNHFSTITKYNSAQKPINYKLVRGMMFTFNKISISETALIDRFIMVDLDKPELRNYEKQPPEELVEFLEVNIKHLGRYFWEYVKEFHPNLESVKNERTTAKQKILETGFEIANKLFSKFGISPLEWFNFMECVSDGQQFIATQEDDVKKEIRTQITKLTNNRIKLLSDNSYNTEFEDFNIYDVINSPNIDKETEKKVLEFSAKKGFFLNSQNDLLITKSGIENLFIKGVKLKKTTDLKEFYDEYEYDLKTGNSAVQTKYMGTKKGFLIKSFIENEEEKINPNTEDESEESLSDTEINQVMEDVF